MKTLISAAALVVAALLCPAAHAQTAPASGWDAHLKGCFASDPSFADPTRGFERLATPANAQRITVAVNDFTIEKTVRMAVWRQNCTNDTNFPVILVRFESVLPASNPSLNLQNRDFELLQNGTATFAELIGWCTNCMRSSVTVVDELNMASNATYVIAQARETNVLLRNPLQFRLRGTTQAVTLGGGSGGSTDQTLGGRLNGTFFDPARGGEGIMVDFFDIADGTKGVFLSWYTYDDAGNLLWLTGNTVLAPNATQVDIPVIVTTGGRFGPLFRAENIRRTGWGTVNLRFPTCSSTVLRYTRTQDGQTGTYNMIRVGPASGVSC